MQKSPLEVDAWRPAPILIRARSGNGRDKKKVSCETLSKVDWYSRRPYEAQLYYHSDDDEEENPASDAEADEHVEYGTEGHRTEDDKDERNCVGNLESHGYGADGFSSQGLHFLACFHARAPDCSAMALSSPGRDAKKTEKMPRTYPSPIPHSGSLLPHSGSLLPHSGSFLPHSGRLLPHSGPIKLHVGSHANTHMNKVSGSARGSTFLIPSNIRGKSSKSSGFGNANEPSSPKVTCFGRVKIRHKYCRDMGRLADMAAGAHNDNVHKSIGDQMMKLTRKKNKAQAVGEDAAPTKERQKSLSKEADMLSRVSVRSGDEKRASKASSLSSAGTVAELQKSGHGWGSHGGDDVLDADAASDSETKGRKGKWRLKEPGVRTKFRRAEKKGQTPDALIAPHGSSDCAIDMNRFRSSQRPQMRENRVSKSLASLSFDDESLKLEQTDDTEFVPQVPPPNSLLLMRNSKSRAGAPCATVAVSSTCQRHRADIHKQAVLVDRQVPPSALKEESSKKLTSALLGAKENETTNLAAAESGHVEQVASFADVKVLKQCAVAPAECYFQRQVSLPKASPEGAGLWQRRSVMKLSPLDVGKPLKLQIKEPTTR